MRIVVDTALNTGSAEYLNMGDVAMLQAGVKRLQSLWPTAQIDVLTESSTDLASFCPGSTALSRAGRELWVGDHAIVGGFDQRLPRRMAEHLVRWSRNCRLRYPVIFRLLTNLRFATRD